MGKEYHLPLNIKIVGKTIKWDRGEGDGNFGAGRKSRFQKNGGGEEYQVVENFIQPWSSPV